MEQEVSAQLELLTIKATSQTRSLVFSGIFIDLSVYLASDTTVLHETKTVGLGWLIDIVDNENINNIYG